MASTLLLGSHNTRHWPRLSQSFLFVWNIIIIIRHFICCLRPALSRKKLGPRRSSAAAHPIQNNQGSVLNDLIMFIQKITGFFIGYLLNDQSRNL